MSYYYSYYIGYKKNGLIFPLGPYDTFGKLQPVIEKSRSFASDLHESFRSVHEDEISHELREQFAYDGAWHGGNEEEMRHVHCLKDSELPNGSFVKRGYFLVKDVLQYEADNEYIGNNELFYDKVPPTVYATMLISEKMFGKPAPIKDEFGEEYQPPAASDYMYYAYPDYNCKEYEVHLIKEMISILTEDYTTYKFLEDCELYVLETEG